MCWYCEMIEAFSFYESVSLTDPQSSKGKASPLLLEAQQDIFPSKLASVAVNSKAVVSKRWKYLGLLCTRNTRSKRCFSPVVALIIFVKPELHLDSVDLGELSPQEMSSLLLMGRKRVPRRWLRGEDGSASSPCTADWKRCMGCPFPLTKVSLSEYPLCHHCYCRLFELLSPGF